MAFDTTCLYSTVRNVSGHSRFFGQLPPHGVTLAADAQTTVFGDIREAVNRGVRVTSKRHRDALKRSLGGLKDDGTADPAGRSLAIINTAAVYLFDSTSDTSKIIVATGGSPTLGLATPCTESSI